MSKSRAKLCFVLGTRPEIIKLSPVIHEAQRAKTPFFILHTGQHYDYRMDRIFFRELKVPFPKYNLHAGSGPHGTTTGKMLEGIEKILLKERPNYVLVQGDTNTVLAGALASAKLGISVAHVEAGLRSYDRKMPEELNRVLTDHMSDYLFCPTDLSARIAQGESISSQKIFVTGNTIVDAVRSLSAPASATLKKFGLQKNKYILLTAHRPANVDTVGNLRTLFRGVAEIVRQKHLQCIFPAHPRTVAMIKKLRITVPQRIALIPPTGYPELLALQKGAYMVMTDSGGIQEEACILKKKCLILRTNTERPETLAVGGAILLKKISSAEMVLAFHKLDKRNVHWRNPFGDGHAARRIIKILRGA